MSRSRDDFAAASKPALRPGPLFVISMGRGGSSLLYALLNKHPQVALMFEADLMCLRPMFLQPSNSLYWPERWNLRNDALRRHGLTPEDVRHASPNFVSAFTATHQLFAMRRGASIWGDKSPFYFDRLNQMADDFPDARFIILWRDPEDTANAVLRAAAAGSAHFSRRGAILRELLGYEVLKKECDGVFRRGLPVCQINYEDLVSETRLVMQKVCEFLEIPYCESVSHLEGADRSAIYVGKFHSLIRRNEIVPGRRPRLTNAAQHQRIGGYIEFWHRVYGENWPSRDNAAADHVRPPHLLRRIIDRTSYRALRGWDQITRIGFALAPITLLNWHRRRHQLPVQQVNSTAHASHSPQKTELTSAAR